VRVTNGWTGGQYSVLRAVFGAYLLVHFVDLLPFGAEVFSRDGVLPDARLSPLWPLFPNVLFLRDTPTAVTALLLLGSALAVCFALGAADRWAAVGLWWVWGCLFTRNPLISNPGLPFVGWLLLAHAFLPGAPYGSWAARGDDDPGTRWRMPGGVYAAAWIVMAIAYTYSGATKLPSPSWRDGTALAHVLENPLARPTILRELALALPMSCLRLATWGALVLELLFAPLAVVGALRPWIWSAMLLMHLGLLTMLDFGDLTVGMLMIQAFTFDPAWIRPRPETGTATLFYDGGCGLCHRAVRFVLAEDRSGAAFRFAPLGGATFEASVPATSRGDLPDSIVVREADGTLRVRSEAVLAIGRRLGGLWRLAATVVGVLPSRLLDALYDGVARLRHRLFAKPKSTCPLLPAHLRARFEG
jgi:predicted DCC family thiol-disulfide oxidoreductase YuxK